MREDQRQPLPLGRSDFAALRQSEALYIDKTELIFDLCREPRKIFMSRPRRFGKSLLVSTFKSLFEDGVRDFPGLAIEGLWNDRIYPVVRLDFSGLKSQLTINEFREALNSLILSAFSPLGFHYDANNPSIFFIDQFKAWLNTQKTNSFVLLIDEYDAPLTNHLDDPEFFDRVRNVMGEFYAAIKQYEGVLRFFFMTGITRFSNTSIFSAFNNLDDISFDPDYGTLLGITEEELESYFDDYLKDAEAALSLSRVELLKELRSHYDGFSFDSEAETHVFCPWSVLNFLNKPKRGFQNYWYGSGGQASVLLNYLKGHELSSPDAFNKPLSITMDELESSRSYQDISLNALLMQAGYLTIKSKLNMAEVELGYPNKEVELSMARLYADELLRNVNRLDIGISTLARMLDTESAEAVVDHFNRVLNALDYQRYPIRDESSCRSHVQVLLMGGAMLPDVEKHSALGRSDLEVRTSHRVWVFEFKFARETSEVEDLLKEAADQIKTQRYGITPHGKELLRVALVFDSENRQFAAKLV